MCLCVELEATRSRLLDSERERSELASLAQHRLEDIGNLNRCVCCLSPECAEIGIEVLRECAIVWRK